MEHYNSHHMQQLSQYISHNRANGVPDLHIRDTLIQSGWPAHLVDQGMHGHVPTPPPAPQAVHHQPQHHSASPAHNPKKYKVSKAFSEAWAAVRANAATFVVSMIVAIGIMIVSLVPTALIILGLARGLESEGSAWLAVLSLVGIFAVTWAWYALVASFMFSVIVLAVNDGANRHRSTVGSVLSRAADVFGRVAMTNVWTGLIALGPPLILFIIILVSVVATGSTFDEGSLIGLMAVVPLVMLLSLVWILLCSVRLALAPYIAVFEPHVAPRETIARSYRLLRDGGIWFIWKLLLIAVAISLILSAFTGMPASELDRSQNPLVTVVQLVMAVIAVTVMLVLYRNRYARHHG